MSKTENELTELRRLLKFQVKEKLRKRIDHIDSKGKAKKTAKIEAEVEALYNELVGKD